MYLRLARSKPDSRHQNHRGGIGQRSHRGAFLVPHQNHRRGPQGSGQVTEARPSFDFGHPNHRRGPQGRGQVAEPRKLFLYNTKITDAGLKELAKLQHLKDLSCPAPKSPTRASRRWPSCRSLQALPWATPKSPTLKEEITDAGLKELAKLQNLITLTWPAPRSQKRTWLN